MKRAAVRQINLAEYIAEILKNAAYDKGEKLNVIVAEARTCPAA